MRTQALIVSVALLWGCILSLLAAPGQSAGADPATGVILLGTGYPRPDPGRAGPSTAVVVGEKAFVVDVGRGVTGRYWAAGLPMKNLRAVFLTHLHSDHTSGLPDLFATSWIFGRSVPLALYGPAGTSELAAALVKYFEADIRIRRDLTEMLPGAGATISARAIEAGVVYEDADVRVTAFAVDHRPVEPAFGYRFDLLAPSGSGDAAVAGSSASPERQILRTIVISGDTRPSENLIRHALNADVLVHEVYLPEHFDRVDTPEVAARLKAYHTSAEEVGRVAAAAGVRLLVLTHIIPSPDDPGVEATLLQRVRKNFKGRIIVGKDLMRF